MTMPRRTRAERRREGSLPAGEDPMLRRPQPGVARPGPVPPAVGRRRNDQPGPSPFPADVPTSATRSTPAPTRGAQDAGPERPPVTSRPAASARGGRAEDRAARAAAGTFPNRRAGDARGADGRQPARAAAAPRTTNLPLTPGPPTPVPENEQARPDDVLDGVAGRPAPGHTAQPAPGHTVQPAPGHTVPPAPTHTVPPAAASEWPAGVRLDPARGGVPVAGPRGPSAGPARVRTDDDVPTEVSAGHDGGGVPELVAGPPSGPVGGRAAARLERQAAEAAQRRSGRRGGSASGEGGRRSVPVAPVGSGEDTPRPGTPRRAVQLVLATVVVALVVLGVWSFTSPQTQEAATQSPAGTSAPASGTAPAVDAGPSAEVAPTGPAVPAGPVRAPVTVLNSTRITGLAAAIGDQFVAGGWQVNTLGAYGAADVAATTVYFTEGDVVQQEAANQLIAQFPDVSGPAPRFFEIPDTPDPGIVVIATGNWRP